MAERPTRLEIEDLKRNLHEVQELLHRQQLVENLVGRQEMSRHDLVEQLVHKQHLAGLHAKLDRHQESWQYNIRFLENILQRIPYYQKHSYPRNR